MMQPPNQHSRINLIELKAQLIKRLGPGRSKQYFRYLNKLLSLKLSKVEFNKVCFPVLGRENVRLHNLLICSVLKNACNAKVPPPPTTIHDNLQIGDVLLSPRKSGASVRLTAKVGSASYESTITSDVVVSENRDTTSRDMQKLVHHHQEILGKADNGRGVVLPNPEIKGSVNDFPSEDGRDRSELLALPLTSSTRYAKSYDIGGLLDSEALRERMEQIASLEGLEGLSMDCANILNSGLDVYLKSWNLEAIDEQRYNKLVSLVDFKVAMELNLQRLGGDRPVLLEKIYMQSSEE
ncbi:putative Glucose-6-phosphate 1-epimerase [Hibiscus syriacus]|uniref:Glucose-6-phosphate 1-epimerase n=1 Tax=Hibiscus syriacus TaxID=106335 RepID=A0A6A3A8I9_HIBSY|nr:putative Glucose-6-phosphate 1-epimerase [Hibiscus syriacus]